jgi:hypothetical protein
MKKNFAGSASRVYNATGLRPAKFAERPRTPKQNGLTVQLFGRFCF